MSEARPARDLRPNPIMGAIAFPFRNLLSLMRIALIPWLITKALVYILVPQFPWLTNPLFPELIGSLRSRGDYDPLNLIPDLLEAPISLLYYALFAMVAVAIHRMIILGERPGWLIYRFGLNELAYAAAFFVVSALLWVPMLAARPFVTPVGSPETSWLDIAVIIYFLVWIILAIKLLMVYPHAAVTGRLSFGSAWRGMKGHLLHSIGVLVGFQILVSILAMLIIGPLVWFVLPQFGDHIREGTWWILVPLEAGMTFIYLLLFAMTVALVSMLYRNIGMTEEKLVP